jgi:hypothetical protein
MLRNTWTAALFVVAGFATMTAEARFADLMAAHNWEDRGERGFLHTNRFKAEDNTDKKKLIYDVSRL